MAGALGETEGEESGEVDVLVVGAGPAGLAAASAAADAGLSVAALESGSASAFRDREDPADVGGGVGGVGLFSDGKFSFRPSATRLWDLVPAGDLDRSYAWLLGLIRDQSWVGSIDLVGHNNETPRDGVIDKRYPSFYMSFEDRERLIGRLSNGLGASLWPGWRVRAVGWRGSHWEVTGSSGEKDGRWRARAVVVAPGRFGPTGIDVGELEVRPGRLEVGIRLEQASDAFLLRGHPATDPKFVIDTGLGWEARTFCCCRGGEVLGVKNAGLVTVCGRADGEDTGRSNVGVLVRAHDEGAAAVVLERCLAVGRMIANPADELLRGRGPIAEVLGPVASKAIVGAITTIADLMGRPVPGAEATAWGMAVEGIGRYPSVSSSLRWGSAPIWVAGDATGLFRGLTAAFVSGYFAGLRAVADLAATER